MPLNTRLKRKSAIQVGLPFGRLGPVVDGANLDTAAQRRTITNYAIMPDTPPVLGGGLTTRRKRGSAIMVGLPFGRVGQLPDGSNLEDSDERRHAAFRYEITFTPSPLPDPNTIICNLIALPSTVGGDIVTLPKINRVRPAPRVQGRTIDLDALIASVERQFGGRPGPKHFPVYQFGSGRNRKIYTELL